MGWQVISVGLLTIEIPLFTGCDIYYNAQTINVKFAQNKTPLDSLEMLSYLIFGGILSNTLSTNSCN